MYPEKGAGTECGAGAPDDCGVPVDTSIELRFDRYLLPKTAVRQSLLLYPAGAPHDLVFLQPSYDVVERVVRYRQGEGSQLEPGLLYEVRIHLPSDNKDGYGFRAYDGAELAKSGSVDLSFSFRTSRVTAASAPPPEPVSCDAFLSVLGSAGCPGCHGEGQQAPMGLLLDSGDGLQTTAIGAVAREADTGPVAGTVLVDPPRFGVGMPIIDPGDPGTSYLLYKLLENKSNYGTDGCATAYDVALPRGACLAPSAAEVEAMQSWFLELDPMPPPERGESLTTGDLRILQGFIQAGAPLQGCR